MNASTAFAPAHITGIFATERKKNLLERGSKGAGVSLTRGVITTVNAEKASEWKVKIYINKILTRAKVSMAVIKEFIPLTKTKYNVQVNHDVQVPIGAGYGASGAGALSLALALNDVLENGLTRIEAAQIAHIAEVKCKTGLGTVLAETFGGIEIRNKAGAPGIGSVVNIKNSNLKVISIFFKPLHTHNFLTNHQLLTKIDKIGNKLLNRLLEKPSVQNLLTLSREFSDELNIYTPKLRKMLSHLNGSPQIFSMNMFGEALFSIVKDDELLKIKPVLEKTGAQGGQIIVSDINNGGARLI